MAPVPWNPPTPAATPHASAEPEIPRRSFLGWFVHGIGGLFAVILGFPLVAYLLDPRHRAAAAGAFKPVAKFDELAVGVPREYVIREDRRDAWTLHPNEIIGRVFLIRQPNDEVKAWTSICPHLGCSVNYTGTTAGTCFLCPCHGGRFDASGVRIDPDHNPAPREMDALETKREGEWILVQYLSFYQGQKAKEVRK